MIVFIFGTTAEAIKVAPVIRRLKSQGINVQLWLTYQHTESLNELLPFLGLEAPQEVVSYGYKGQSLKKPSQMFGWLLSCLYWFAQNRIRLKKVMSNNDIIVVHGDTMTSVLGAYFAKRLGIRCAHIEAGLRSGNIRHPFPEELDRRIVGLLADIHYVPSDEAAENLRGKQNVVNTKRNTVIDAVLDNVQSSRNKPENPYGLVLLHRFEFISNQSMVENTLMCISKYTKIPLIILVDEYSRNGIEATIRKLEINNISISPKLEHKSFVEALQNSEFVVTDSGGIHQEAALLGIPTLVHRFVSETKDGIGRNVVLSGWDLGVVQSFLENYLEFRFEIDFPEVSPSDVISQHLISLMNSD